MRPILLIVFCLPLLWLVQPCFAVQADIGGIFVDDFQITNDGVTVLFDNFQDRDIRDWRVKDADVFSMSTDPPVNCLYINEHTKVIASASRAISVSRAGVVELNVLVWLPPVKDQYNWRNNTICTTDFVLYSGNTKDAMRVGIELRPKETSYRILLWWQREGVLRPAKFVTEKTVLDPGRWSLLTLRMNPATGKAYALLEGKEQLSMVYKPDNFESLKSATILSRFGDYKYEPQPRVTAFDY